jgi:hypothetical protein
LVLLLRQKNGLIECSDAPVGLRDLMLGDRLDPRIFSTIKLPFSQLNLKLRPVV